MWKASERVGFGVADGDGTFVVANYDPRGNVINFLSENVLRNYCQSDAKLHPN